MIKRVSLLLCLLILLSTLVACGGEATPTASPNLTFNPAPTTEPEPTPTIAPVTPTIAPTFDYIATVTPTTSPPTAIATPKPTATSTPKPTATIAAPPTATPTITPRPLTPTPTGDSANLITLYDGAQNSGLPDTQGFSYLTNPILGASANQLFGGGLTTLDTRSKISDSAGYFARSNLLPDFDRKKGYTVRFKVQVVGENHEGSDKNKDGVADRAGFSVIVLSNDFQGVELGFWTNQIWAQDDSKKLFTHAEGVNFNTTTGLIPYELTILGDNYSLSANGKKILSNRLRNYSSFGWPYSVNNFLFMGDNTTSASGLIRLASVQITLLK